MSNAGLSLMATRARREPTLDEIMADPIVRVLMRADKVDPQRLRAKLDRLAEGLKGEDGEASEDLVAPKLYTPCWAGVSAMGLCA
ncbi:hypothetical protein [Mangrovibrevibacter kandeliae]|uniref:hypothetical protein n=1 Tax=Mangrovibrevibacter kandeliae TaxID=2968473 RepID=UPI002119B602|nr:MULTISPECIES: hypothetical protein [unclassified Aurantimonas]MCQ8783363.1 hypothetical protein [Aurantimonas sp. CSK15Z-1]MCW4116122.1 hypothetical protein [Aurantimonas sp. MSK8Z-1]